MMCTWGGWAGLSFLSSGQKERIHRKNQTLKKKRNQKIKLRNGQKKREEKQSKVSLSRRKGFQKLPGKHKRVKDWVDPHLRLHGPERSPAGNTLRLTPTVIQPGRSLTSRHKLGGTVLLVLSVVTLMYFFQFHFV